MNGRVIASGGPGWRPAGHERLRQRADPLPPQDGVREERAHRTVAVDEVFQGALAMAIDPEAAAELMDEHSFPLGRRQRPACGRGTRKQARGTLRGEEQGA